MEFSQFEKFYVRYYFVFKDNTRRDVTNYLKAFEDVVFRLFIKIDDSKVYETKVVKIIDRRLNTHFVRIEWEEYKEREYKFSFPKELTKNKKTKKMRVRNNMSVTLLTINYDCGCGSIKPIRPSIIYGCGCGTIKPIRP